jgi:hypothetical protein
MIMDIKKKPPIAERFAVTKLVPSIFYSSMNMPGSLGAISVCINFKSNSSLSSFLPCTFLDQPAIYFQCHLQAAGLPFPITASYSGCHKYVPFVIFVNKHHSSL